MGGGERKEGERKRRRKIEGRGGKEGEEFEGAREGRKEGRKEGWKEGGGRREEEERKEGQRKRGRRDEGREE